MTLAEICAWTNWTPYRANQRLYRLQKQACVELIERGQHRTQYNSCGVYRAIPDVPEPSAEARRMTFRKKPYNTNRHLVKRKE